MTFCDTIECIVRLNKYIASCGICSRREADRLIEEGKVLVNGKPGTPGQDVTDADVVTVGKKNLSGPDKKAYLAFYKPVGVTCSEKDAHAEKLIRDLVDYPVRVTYAGRLDRDSEGLMILTNDGDLIDAMMRARSGHEKEYVVKTDREADTEFLKKMSEGVYLEALDATTRPCKVEKIGKYTFSIILTQGLNRQIRRMCGAFHRQVQSLKRIRVVNITLGDLKPGQYRELTEEEIKGLKEAVHDRH